MRVTSRVILGLALAALAVAGCSKIGKINAPPLSSGGADFTTYVAMGTSISMGVQSGGAVDRHQIYAFPALFAQQIGRTVELNGQGSFTFPSINGDGIPPLVRIRQFGPPTVIDSIGRVTGSPVNIGQSTVYHNLGIYGAIVKDVTSAALYGRSPFFGIVLRGLGTVVREAASLNPTFISFEYGANEVLGPATSGVITSLPSVAEFDSTLRWALDSVAVLAPAAKLVMFNIPDPTGIPFVTNFPPVSRNDAGNPIGLLGPGGLLLTPADRVLLSAGPRLAAGTGFPLGSHSYIAIGPNTYAPGTGRFLTDSLVLSANEISVLQTRLAGYNHAIERLARDRGAALVDLNALLRSVATTGIDFAGTTYTSAFVTGGFFSLDGVHPTDFAQGVICNAMIEAVNARFGAHVPLLDLNRVMTASSSSVRPAPDEDVGIPWIAAGGVSQVMEAFRIPR
jgi:hypothetical protein